MLIYLFFLGLCIGSFLNVLIDRLPHEQGIGGRSHCDHCKKTLSMGDLVPVFSYLMLRGRCRYCRKKLSPQYPIIEFFTGSVFVLVWLFAPAAADILRILYVALASCFIVIFIADLKYHIIPDEMQFVFFIIAILLLWAGGGQSFVFIGQRLLEGGIVMFPILFLYFATNRRGMGFGDVKLAYVMGVLLGTKYGLYALYFAFVIGGVVSLLLMISRKKKLKSHIAFGPFLIVGTIAALWWGSYFDALLWH